MPKRILVYVCDYDKDSTPIFAVATNLKEIPEDYENQPVAEYTLVKQGKLVVNRELKPCNS